MSERQVVGKKEERAVTERIGTIGKPLYHHWSARDYVQSGLVFQYDGIENNGYGVHADSGKWIDLISSTPSYGSMSFDDNSVTIAGGSLYNVYYGSTMPQTLVSVLASGTSTVEWCAKVAEIDSGNASRNQLFYNYASSSMCVAMAYVVIGGKTTWTTLNYSGGYAILSRAAIQDGSNGRILDNITGTEWNATGCTQVTPSVFRSQLYFVAGTISHLYAYRVYNRVLTADEIAYNSRIDKLRFGIP